MKLSGLLMVVLGVVLAGCGGVPGLGVASAQEVKSNHARQTAPAVSSADTAVLVRSNNTFAWELYHTLPKDGNLFFSPYSISQALAMTYAGAHGMTAQQMATTLHFTLPAERLHPAFNALDQALTAHASKPASQDQPVPFTFKNANAIWGQRDYQWQPTFLDLLAEQYGAGLRAVDFKTAPEPARATINDWVKQATEGKIADLLPSGSVTQMTRMVLTNAIYFKADWEQPFKKEFTRPDTWTFADGKQAQVPMMTQQSQWGYTAGSNYQSIELPYVGGMAMDIILPTVGQFSTFEPTLTDPKVGQILAALQNQVVLLTMPKFDFAAPSFSLADVLKALGMHDAFIYSTADFRGMDGTRELYIGDVIHKAMVKVDERGTEAAAASAVTMMAGSAANPTKPVEFRIDHPFVFLIRDAGTGTVLFMGRVTQPQP